MKLYAKIIDQAKKSCIEKLASKGIKDKFIVKMKKLDNKDWVAQYRAKSQFGRAPIFWISEELLDHPDQFILSILHEYGHVVAEWAHARSHELKDLIYEFWPGDNGEEEFAEDFAHYIHGGLFLGDKEILEKVISIYSDSVGLDPMSLRA